MISQHTALSNKPGLHQAQYTKIKKFNDNSRCNVITFMSLFRFPNL